MSLSARDVTFWKVFRCLEVELGSWTCHIDMWQKKKIQKVIDSFQRRLLNPQFTNHMLSSRIHSVPYYWRKKILLDFVKENHQWLRHFYEKMEQIRLLQWKGSMCIIQWSRIGLSPFLHQGKNLIAITFKFMPYDVLFVRLFSLLSKDSHCVSEILFVMEMRLLIQQVQLQQMAETFNLK